MNAIGDSQRPATMVALLAITLLPIRAAAEVVTLQEVESLALQNQARWEVDQARTAQAEAEVVIAQAERKPTFTIEGTGVMAPGSDIVQVPTVDGSQATVRAAPPIGEATAFRANAQYEARLAMRAPLYDFGRTRAAIDAAKAYRRATEARAATSRDEVIASVRALYLDWLAAYMLRDLAIAAAEEAQAHRERTMSRVEEGERPGSALDAARYEEMREQLAATDADVQLARARRRLESAGRLSLTSTAQPDVELLLLEDIDEPSVARREIEALRQEGDAVRLEARMYRRTRAPVLAAVAQTGLQGVNATVFPSYRLGLTLAVSLWDGGKAIAQARAVDARAGELLALEHDRRVALDHEATAAHADRANAEAQLTIAEALVAISDKRVEQAEAAYELGDGDLDAVAHARAALREARSRLVRVQTERADAILRLSPTPVLRNP